MSAFVNMFSLHRDSFNAAASKIRSDIGRLLLSSYEDFLKVSERTCSSNFLDVTARVDFISPLYLDDKCAADHLRYARRER